MPQMAPLMWLTLFIWFILIFLLFNILNYFMYILKSPEKQASENSFMNNKNNMFWKW